jgi:hypothetical protein
MLEEQQEWLVDGLQVLYQITCDGDVWPHGPVECNEAGRPFVHDLLARLGSLDPTRSRFVEGTSAWQPNPREELESPNLLERSSQSAGSQSGFSSPDQETFISSLFSNKSHLGILNPEPSMSLSCSMQDAFNLDSSSPSQEWAFDEDFAWNAQSPSFNGSIMHAPCDGLQSISLQTPTIDDLLFR